MKYFKKGEFSCPHCGRNEMDADFMVRLDEAREKAGVPFRINSGFRCEEHNQQVGGKPDSAHTKGLAADIKATTSGDRFAILQALYSLGFVRVGIAKTFIHVDADPEKPQDMTWVYS